MSRSTAERVAEACRRWDRLGAGSGSLAVVDPDVPGDTDLTGPLRAVGVHAVLHHDPLAALVRLGAHAPDVVLVSTAVRAPELGRLVAALRTELSVPVLLAFLPDEIPLLGPAVAAGARPALVRPYGVVDVLGALEPHWPRRSAGGDRVRSGDLLLDVDGYDAHLGRTRVDLTTVEFDVLAALTRRSDRVVSRRSLSLRFWPRSSDPDGALVATIARIRRKLTRAGAGDPIRTVRGVGYRLDSAALVVTTPTPRAGS